MFSFVAIFFFMTHLEIQGLRLPSLTSCRYHTVVSFKINAYAAKMSAVVVQWLSHVCLWPHGGVACQAFLSFFIPWSLLKLLSIESVMPSNHFVLCRPLLLLPLTFSSIRVFCNESALRVRWPKYWSFSFRISLSNEYPGLISFRMDWLDLFAVQGTLKSLLQHHISKASILHCSAFFMVQLSHPYMTTGKTIALTRQKLLAK